MNQLRDVVRAEFGPWAFWKAFGRLWVRAKKAGRQYLSWEEWDEALALAEQHGIFSYYKGGRDYNERRGEDIRVDDLVHRTSGPMLISVFRRVKKARAEGLSPWQFQIAEDARIDADRARVASIHLQELVRTRAARAANDKERNRRYGGGRRAGRRAADAFADEDPYDESLPLPE